MNMEDNFGAGIHNGYKLARQVSLHAAKRGRLISQVSWGDPVLELELGAIEEAQTRMSTRIVDEYVSRP
jgi:hypothetical protein